MLGRLNEGSLGPLNPIPTACIVLSTFAWLMYAFSVPNPWVVASNLPGACAAMAAMTMMLPLMKGSSQLPAVQSTLVGGTLLSLLLWSYLIFSGMAAAARSHFLGLYASAFFIILAASPLSTIKDVIASKDSSSIYGPMTAAQCTNSALWTVYGFFGAKDVFVWGPNATGFMLGVLQLLLKIVFPSVTKKALNGLRRNVRLASCSDVNRCLSAIDLSAYP